MGIFILLLEVAGAIFFLLAGLEVPSQPRLAWLGWGLFFWSLAFLLGGGAALAHA